MSNAEPNDTLSALNDALDNVTAAEDRLRAEGGMAELVSLLAQAADAIRYEIGLIEDGIPSTDDRAYAVEVAR